MNNHKNIKIRLSDIAQKLNYSTATISKALRNHIDIPLQTTIYIQNTAEKMGYFPNILARNLSTKKSNIIGMIVPKITDIFFSTLVESMFDIAYSSNYSIVLMVSQDNASREKIHIETLLAMQVAGIIISISQETKDNRIFEKIRSRNIPVVFVNKIPEMEGISTIPFTDYETAFKATRHAMILGYRNIAYIGFKSTFNINQGELRDFGRHIINRNEKCLILELPNLIFTTIQTLTEH